jgi:hypothetical protein
VLQILHLNLLTRRFGNFPPQFRISEKPFSEDEALQLVKLLTWPNTIKFGGGVRQFSVFGTIKISVVHNFLFSLGHIALLSMCKDVLFLF